MGFSKKDFYYGLLTGFYTGLIVWLVAQFLKLPPFFGIAYGWLPIIVPMVWLIGVWLGYFLAHWLVFFHQFGKFSAVGFTNAAVDFGILNLGIALTGITNGREYALIRALAALVAITHSYFWNRRWVFESQRQDIAGEFRNFFGAALISGLVNIGIATAVVNFVRPLASLSPERWANVGAIIGSATALTSNFIILRQGVFNRPNT